VYGIVRPAMTRRRWHPHILPSLAKEGASPHAVGSSPPKRLTLMYLQHGGEQYMHDQVGIAGMEQYVLQSRW